MSPAFWNAVSAEALLLRVTRRLEAEGGFDELRRIGGMSAQELDVLLRQEREGWG